MRCLRVGTFLTASSSSSSAALRFKYLFVSDRLASLRAKRPSMPAMNTVLEGKNDIEKTLPVEVEEAHTAAMSKGEEYYVDPKTGMTVFTRQTHINKGRCCGCRCRHCPYGHINVPESRRFRSPPQSTEGTDTASTTVTTVSPIKTRKSNVYTKGGDKGSSSLFTGERRSKSDLVFHALGSVDELNSHVGLAHSFLLDDSRVPPPVKEQILTALQDIQRRMFHCGALFATTAVETAESAVAPIPHRPEEWTRELEVLIDSLDASLPPLTSFILPGGGPTAAQLHVCRSTCRRAERWVVELLQRDEAKYDGSPAREAAVFINRLSDFFFVAARATSDITKETKWLKESS